MNGSASIFLRSSVLVLSLSLAACGGGGGGGGGGGTPPSPPAGLTYAVPAASYEAHAAIAANAPSSTGGAIASYGVAPALPAGLTINASTGVIAGTPAASAIGAASNYVVTGTNSAGSTQATVNIGVTPGSETLTAMPPGAMTDADIRFFLGRTWFGGTTADFNACRAAGISAFTDQMLAYVTDPTLEANADALLNNPSDPPGLSGKFPSPQQLAQRSLYLMLNTSNPFQEILAFFWHDHFAASDSVLDGGALYWMKTHMDLWRREGSGNLRTLLVDMARDWVMLDWLSGDQSTKFAPNENFAREFWELFTLGVDNGYTQSDITVAARAWTGYKVTFDAVTNLSSIVFDPNRHDAASKTFFGQTIAAQNSTDDYQAVVDITLAQKQVAEFICKKLFEYFCYQAPTSAPVNVLAATLRSNSYDLTPVLQQLLKSEAFFSAKSKAGQVKSPVENALTFVRTTGLPLRRLSDFANQLTATGQVPTQPPTVNGWPDNTGWLSAQGMLDRANLMLSCITDRGVQQANPLGLLPNGTATTDVQAVDALALLMHVTLSPSDHATCVTYLDTDQVTHAASPFNAGDPAQVDSRVRGLIYVLSQHPTYQIR